MHTGHWFCYCVGAMCSVVVYFQSKVGWISPTKMAAEICTLLAEKEEWINQNATEEFVEWTKNQRYDRKQVDEYTQMLERYLQLKKKIGELDQTELVEFDQYLIGHFGGTAGFKPARNILYQFSPQDKQNVQRFDRLYETLQIGKTE